MAKAWASSAAPLWSSCIIQPKLANLDDRGQEEEVIFGLTDHCEQLNLVAVGLTGQQLVIKVVQRQAPPLYGRWGEKPSLALPAAPRRFLTEVFGTTRRGKLLWSSQSSETCKVVGTSSAKTKEEGIQVAVRGAECARGGGADRPPPNRLASGKKKKDRRFEGVWCAWDPAVRTSGALAFAALVYDSKELLSQDH